MKRAYRAGSFLTAVLLLLLMTSLVIGQEQLNMSLKGNFGKGEGDSKTAFAAGSLVYYSIGNKVQIASFSNPGNPMKVGSIILGETIEDLVRTSINGTYYVLASGGSYLYIINVQTPTNPVLTTAFEIGGYGGGVATSGATAFVASYGAGLKIVNVANPAVPVVVATVDSVTSTESVFISSPYAYIAMGDKTQIFNVSDPAAPTFAGVVTGGGYHQYAAVRGNYLYVVDYDGGDYASGYVRIYNVANVASPTFVTAFNTGYRSRRIVFDGNYGYVAVGDNGISILDLTNAAAPTLAGTCDTPGRANILSFGAVTVGGIPKGHIFVADRPGGLRAIDVSNPAAPAETGALPVLAAASGSAYGNFLDSGKLYVAYGTAGLRILDVSVPSQPTLLSTLEVGGDSRGVVVKDNYAFVAARDSGVYVIDATNPAAPVKVNTLKTPRARGVAISGNYVYVAASDSGMGVIDASTPANAQVIGYHHPDGHYGENVAVHGTIAGLTAWDKIVFFDIANPLAPAAKGLIPTLTTGNEGFAIVGTHAYVPDGDYLRIFDLANMNSPAKIAEILTGGYDYMATVAGDFCYVAAEGAGVRAINIANPAAPVEEGYYDGSAKARWVSAADGFIYVSELSDGVSVYSNDKISAVAVRPEMMPVDFTLQQNYPNPFNPTTKITFLLPEQMPANLQIHDLLGRSVAKLLDKKLDAGIHAVIFNAAELPAGIYFCRLAAGGTIKTTKMTLLK
ncbi:MAG TPA: T9SS type A sorting domain-containing protein [bacterium]|nr:T9SS type A sorting domain-containing protein [bacterium]HOZ20510.1 T9SS type A sorting domain-containing protein [bacterium]